MTDTASCLQDEREKAVRDAVKVAQRKDTELCARLIYRSSRDSLRRAGITTPNALYDELKQVFWNVDEGITLGDHLSVGFGKIDRRRQVRAFTECHANEPKNIIAKSYEREYGFSAGLAAIWIDLFTEHSSISVSEWLGEATATKENEDILITRTSPTGEHEKNDDLKATTLSSFFRRELNGNICDASLVRQRFAFEFPDEQPETLRSEIERAGYYEDHDLFFLKGSTPNNSFKQLLSSHSSFARGEEEFENSVWQHPTFRYVLRQELSNHHIFAYDDESYISFTRLHDVLGLSMKDVETYAPSVNRFVPKDMPFTAASLHASSNFSHPLYTLDMPNNFYESLLETSGLFRSCTLAGAKVFITGEKGRFSAASLIEWIVAHHEGIGRGDLLQLLSSDFDITCPIQLLMTTVHNSDIYYDDIEDIYYSSMKTWKKEVHNELA